MNGFLIVYKPKGISSFDVIRSARKALQTKKIGHAGTLDPLAEGLLLLGVGGGTKALSQLLLSSKSYRAKMMFGVQSSTGDEEGEKIRVPISPFLQEDFEKILPRFLGKISQMPPVYSALKINGKRACDRVRNGEEVVLSPRMIEIITLTIVDFCFPNAEIFVECSSGTYIRSLVQNLGEAMESTAYMTALTRESLGNFSLSDACALDEISWERVHPFLPEHFSIPTVFVSPPQPQNLFMGRAIKPENFPIKEGQCALFWEEKFLGFGKIQDGYVLPQKMLGIME